MGIASGNTPWQDFPSTATPITAGRLNAIEDALDANAAAVSSLATVYTPEEFGAVGDGVTDDSAAINAAMAAANTNGGGTVVFAGGTTYAIASKITLPAVAPVHLRMGTGGQLLATAAMTAMIEKPTGGYGSGSIYEGLKLNGGLLAERCLDIQQSQGLKIKSPDLLRFTYAGAEFGRTAGQNYELEWTGGAVTGKLGGDGGTAAQLPAYGILNGPSGVTDNFYSDIKIKNVGVGVWEQGQADVWHMIHIYNYPFATTAGATDWSDGSVGFLVPGYHNRITACYMDTLQTGVRITGSFVRLTDCQFLWPSIHVPSYAPVGVDVQAPGATVIGSAFYPGNPTAQDVTAVQFTASAYRPVIIGNHFGGGAAGYPAGGPFGGTSIAALGGTRASNHWDGGTIPDYTNNRQSNTHAIDLGDAGQVIQRWYGANPGQFLAVGSGASGYVRIWQETAGGGFQLGATGNTLGFLGAAPLTRRPNTRATRSILSDFGLCDAGTVEPGRVGVGARSASATLTSDAAEYQRIDATSGAVTITLPTVTTPGITFTFKKVDASANAVTIAAAGTSPLIDASPTYTLTARWQHVRIVSNGSSGVWEIIGAG